MSNRFLPEKLQGPFYSDTLFDRLYPVEIQELAAKHWTPLYVARKAAYFLAPEKGVRILDIGSGIGKFCIAAATLRPDAFFYGVEQRAQLVYYADKIKMQLGVTNVEFIHSNFTKSDLRDYDHFYFYNSFYENLVGTDKIDHNISYSTALYHYYTHYMNTQLEKMPAGTRLTTFHSMEEEIPAGFQAVGSDGPLKYWAKI